MTPDVEVKLLGQLRLQVAGSAVNVSAPRLRNLLGVLAFSAGDVVTVETIGDRVWGDEPPARGRRSPICPRPGSRRRPHLV